VHQNVDDTERTIRASAGASLLGAGLANGPPGPGNVAAVAGGSYLLATGIGGHCPAYELLGVDRSEAGRERSAGHEGGGAEPIVIEVE
jgi:hypothetical protein